MKCRGAAPGTIFGASQKRRPRHLDDANNQPVPVGVFKRLGCVEHIDLATFFSRAPFVVEAFKARQRGIRPGDTLDDLQQAGLVFLYLNQHVAIGFLSRFKSFFGSAWRPSYKAGLAAPKLRSDLARRGFHYFSHPLRDGRE